MVGLPDTLTSIAAARAEWHVLLSTANPARQRLAAGLIVRALPHRRRGPTPNIDGYHGNNGAK